MRKELGGVRNLSMLYISALTLIALLVMSGEFWMQYALDQQTSDSRVVNIAGRQRMLSQKLSKEAMLIAQNPSARKIHNPMFEDTLKLWQKSYAGLLRGDSKMGLPGKNSPAVLQMFETIEKSFTGMVHAALEILRVQTAQNSAETESLIRGSVETLLLEEPHFLQGMNRIVFQYDLEAKSRVARSKRVEWLLLWAALFVLILEGLFIFRPAVRKLSRTLIELKQEQARTRRIARRLQLQNRKLNQVFTENLDISEQERRRIALDLHDHLSQEISGISCMTKALQKKINLKYSGEWPELENINGLINGAMDHTREIARGLYPMTVDGDGLLDKLKDLSAHTEKVFGVHCRFISPDILPAVDQKNATHLYCIVREAIHNSIRHGKAKSIRLAVYEKDNAFGVSVADDGTGFSGAGEFQQGLGIRIMKYRSELINGQLNFSKNELGGTTVTCEVLEVPHGTG